MYEVTSMKQLHLIHITPELEVHHYRSHRLLELHTVMFTLVCLNCNVKRFAPSCSNDETWLDLLDDIPSSLTFPLQAEVPPFTIAFTRRHGRQSCGHRSFTGVGFVDVHHPHFLCFPIDRDVIVEVLSTFLHSPCYDGQVQSTFHTSQHLQQLAESKQAHCSVVRCRHWCIMTRRGLTQCRDT